VVVDEACPQPLESFGAVFALARDLRRQVGEIMAGEAWVGEAGLRPPCMGVIHVLAEHGPVSQREISDRLDVDASDVVGVLDLLESAGLVERKRDPDDRRRHAVVLTAEGHKAARRLATVRAQAEARAFSRLTADELCTLTDLANRALGRLPASESRDSVVAT